jgi:hypothetical protein
VGTELLHADGRTNRYEEANIVVFRAFAKALESWASLACLASLNGRAARTPSDRSCFVQSGTFLHE